MTQLVLSAFSQSIFLLCTSLHYAPRSTQMFRVDRRFGLWTCGESSYLFLLGLHNNVRQFPTVKIISGHSSTILRIRCYLSLHLLNPGPHRNRMLRVGADWLSLQQYAIEEAQLLCNGITMINWYINLFDSKGFLPMKKKIVTRQFPFVDCFFLAKGI